MTRKCASEIISVRRLQDWLLTLAGMFLLLASPSDSLAETDLPHPSFTWSLNPTSNDWNTAANWMPQGIPDTQSERAIFGASTITNISGSATVHDITFNAGASPFTINGTFTFNDGGVTNNSGIVQTFNGFFHFQKDATAGSSLNVFNGNSSFVGKHHHGPSAGSATFIGTATFNKAGADSPTFVIPGGGFVGFLKSGAGGSVTIENGGGTAFGAGGGQVSLTKSVIVSGTIVNQGGAVFGGHGARLLLNESSWGSGTLIANGGQGPDSGAKIVFTDHSSGGTSRIEVYGNGNLDVSPPGADGTGVGSIEGNGLVFLGGNNLTVGTNDLNTTFAGLISDEGGLRQGAGGSLTKSGTGTLILTNANTYTGATIIDGGVLLVNNTSGSGTGDGAVEVRAGTLGGNGTIAGAVTVGTGTGTGGIVSPGLAGGEIGTLVVQSGLTFDSDGIFDFELDSNAISADGIVANGVTVNGASFALTDLGIRTLPLGTAFTVINNTTVTPISGTFSNLPNGSIVTINDNNLQASYEGGDGNDLILTVVPPRVTPTPRPRPTPAPRP